MSDHSKVLVPIESWCYQSPDVVRNDCHIDIGLFAESLIYYNQVFVNPTNEPQFSEFICWFIKQGKFSDFISLILDGTVNIYYYSFATPPIRIAELDEFILAHIQDEEAAQRDIFESRVLNHPSLVKVTHARQRSRLRSALRDKIVEIKAAQVGLSVLENARHDYVDPERSALLVQALIDELYLVQSWGTPPRVTATVIELSPHKHRVTWSVNLDNISRRLPKELTVGRHTPGAAAAVGNRLLWSASSMNCDLYLGSPLSVLVGNKLQESTQFLRPPELSTKLIIDDLVSEVDFPDVRLLVNEGKIGIAEVLELRKRAENFRRWLQYEGDRDRNAIIAYHNEVARDSGFTRRVRKTLRIFGWLTSILAGPTGATLAGADGALAGAIAGQGMKYVAELAAKQNENWRPVVFGKWAKQYLYADGGF